MNGLAALLLLVHAAAQQGLQVLHDAHCVEGLAVLATFCRNVCSMTCDHATSCTKNASWHNFPLINQVIPENYSRIF